MEEAAGRVARPGLSGGLQHAEGAPQVGLDELGGPGDAAVHVALGGEVEELGDVVLLDEVPGQLQVLHIAHHQLDTFQPLDLGAVGGIGQLVQHQDAICGMVAVPAVHQVGADEARAAGDEDGFGHGTPKKGNSPRRARKRKEKGKLGW